MRRSKIVIMAAAFVSVLAISSAAMAQAIRVPNRGSSPFGRDITGFMQLSVGITAMPWLDLEPDAHTDGTTIDLRDISANVPGFTAGMWLIPTWGPHGVMFGATYDLTGGHYRQSVDDGILPIDGETELGLAQFTVRSGYVHYFGEYDWHPYLLADVGAAWERARIESNYEHIPDEVHESRAVTSLLGLGMGIGKETTSGFFSGELRADYYPFPTKMEFGDPIDKFDLTISHPLIVKLILNFAIGHL